MLQIKPLSPATDEVDRMEAPVTFKAYMMCAFAAFGGIFFGYDSGYINGVMGMPFFKHELTGLPYPGPNASLKEIGDFCVPSKEQSLIVSILSAGTFLVLLSQETSQTYTGAAPLLSPVACYSQWA